MSTIDFVYEDPPPGRTRLGEMAPWFMAVAADAEPGRWVRCPQQMFKQTAYTYGTKYGVSIRARLDPTTGKSDVWASRKPKADT